MGRERESEKEEGREGGGKWKGGRKRKRERGRERGREEGKEGGREGGKEIGRESHTGPADPHRSRRERESSSFPRAAPTSKHTYPSLMPLLLCTQGQAGEHRDSFFIPPCSIPT